MTGSFSVKTDARTAMKDITSLIRDEIEKSGVKEGICIAYVPHTTAGITINEGADPSVCHDIIAALDKLVPPNAGYRHLEGNSDSHIKTGIVGNSVTVIIQRGGPVLGTWQRIFLCEFDGPRTRKVIVKIQ